MSEQENLDYIEEIDPEEFKAYKDFYDLTNKHCDLVIYSLWHAEEISKKILGTNFPMGSYLHLEAKDYEVKDCPKGKLAAYEILLNEFKTGCSFYNGMKGEVTLNILNCFIKAASGDITSDEAKFVHYLLKKDECEDVFFPKQTKEFTIDLEESLKKFDKILFYFLRCKQDYRYREIADSFSRILELLDKVIERKGDYFLEDTTIIELVELFCGRSFNASGEDAEKFINLKKAFRYANLRQEAFDVQNTLRKCLSYKGLNSEAAKVLESMVDKFGYKASLTISELLLTGRYELEKDQEKAIFYLEEFLDGWRYDEEKGDDYDFPLALHYSRDQGIFNTRVKDYFENIPADSKNALSFFKCALKILEISDEFECNEEVHDWYGRFVNENFEKLIDFGKKAKKAHSTFYLKELLSFCFVHLTRSPEMEKEVIFLCLLPLSDEEIFEDWVSWGSEICQIDDQEAFDQLVKVIYVNLEKCFQENPGLTDYLFSMMSEFPEKIENKEELLLPRDSKWYLLPMKGNQEVFDDFEIDTSFESNVKADTYKIETKQQEKNLGQ